MPSAASDAFRGTDRFTVVRRIGAGGMGVVYEAYDREREMAVALKTLPRFEASALYQFKEEFRSLADIAHPNLIALYELIADQDRWFFTMELVKGVSFLKYVRPEQAFLADSETPTVSQSSLSGAAESSDGHLSAGVTPTPWVEADATGLTPLPNDGQVDLERLRHVLPQVARGVAAVHAAGKLHRDLKPSNVLITREGRVVILDFGLVREIEPRASDRQGPRDLSGTIDYMAPEQAAGQALTAAADWYSVGVMLYEGLTGRRPFTGSVLEVLRDKQTRTPDAPKDLLASTPADLDALCMALLERRPDRRPSGADVGSFTLGATRQADHPAAIPAGVQRTQLLVGRERHRAVLRDAFASVVRGRAVNVLVHGAAGMGKSALIREFLDEVALDPDVVLASGRCYENESVPYKAFDSMIDRLGMYLADADEASVTSWLPADAGLLAHLFPVLRRVDGIARAARDAVPVSNPQELRRRGFTALRMLLTRIGETRRLVLHIDDLHWGDLDSAVLLSHLLRSPSPPVMLFVSAYRSGEHASSPCVRALMDQEVLGAATLLELEPLGMPDAVRLAKELMTASVDPDAAGDADAIARESGGNPYFIGELVARRSEVSAVAAGGGDVTLERVLCAGIDELPEQARQLLEVVAVSGQPIHQSDAFSAARLSSKDPGALALLRKKNLVRTTGTSDHLLVDTYHDRVREALLASLGPETIRRHHYHLAHTLEASRRAEPETLGRHLDAAGELDRARQFYVAGGDAAARTLTFDHAARLYRRATELGSPDPVELRALRVKLAGALANAGHCREAAIAYEAAARDAGPGEAVDLLRRAGYYYSIGGYADEGRAVFDDLFRRLRMRLPATPRQAVRRMLWDLAQLKVRGLGFRERHADAIAPAELGRIDLVWAAATGLMEFDLITGAELHTRGLLLSLRSGEPYRIARVLAVAAMSSTSEGTPAKARIQQLLTRARTLAHKVDHPHARALVALAEGIAYWLVDRRWDAARKAFGEANDLLRNHTTGMTWEMNLMHSHRVWMHYFQGHFSEGVNYSAEVIREARDRGDAYLQVNLGTFAAGYGRLMADDPDGARASIQQVAAQLPQRVTNIQRVHQMMTRCHIDLYSGDPAAWAGITANWPLLVETYQLRSEQMRIQMYHLRARAALCALPAAPDPKPLVAEAESVARRLEKELPPWAHAEAQLIRAGLAVWRGDRAAAADLLDAAARTFEAFGCGQFSTPAWRWQGALMGGDRGRQLVAAADEALAGQGIRNPERWSRTWVTIPVKPGSEG